MEGMIFPAEQFLCLFKAQKKPLEKRLRLLINPCIFLRRIKIRGFVFLRKADFICDSLENLEKVAIKFKNRLNKREKSSFIPLRELFS